MAKITVDATGEMLDILGPGDVMQRSVRITEIDGVTRGEQPGTAELLVRGSRIALPYAVEFTNPDPNENSTTFEEFKAFIVDILNGVYTP